MQYQVKTIFKQPIDQVIHGFIDVAMMKRWQPHLVDIEAVKGVWPESGFEGYLIYDVTGVKSKMSVKVLENDLPDKLVFVYEVPGVYNRCDYHFKDLGQQTDYQMDVIFTFEDGIERPEALFKGETTRIMNVFKSFIEGI
jgi:hypothetical protein